MSVARLPCLDQFVHQSNCIDFIANGSSCLCCVQYMVELFWCLHVIVFKTCRQWWTSVPAARFSARFKRCTAVRPSSCTAARYHGCTSARPNSYTSVRSNEYSAARSNSYTSAASSNSCTAPRFNNCTGARSTRCSASRSDGCTTASSFASISVRFGLSVILSRLEDFRNYLRVKRFVGVCCGTCRAVGRIQKRGMYICISTPIRRKECSAKFWRSARQLQTVALYRLVSRNGTGSDTAGVELYHA